jgi:succinate-semialdehyde dehydrogenase/glutarate-semialdehyde dehydrogenase
LKLKDASLFFPEGYISGGFSKAKTGKTFPVYEPSSAEVLGEVADFALEDFQDALKASEIAFKSYAKSTTAAERGKLLRKWYELCIANIDDCRSTHALLLAEL